MSEYTDFINHVATCVLCKGLMAGEVDPTCVEGRRVNDRLRAYNEAEGPGEDPDSEDCCHYLHHKM